MKNRFLILSLLILCSVFNSITAQVRFEKEFNFEPAPSYFQEWVEIDGKMYFSANDGYFGQELWQFDPATEQATRLTDLRSTSGNSYPRDIFEYDNKIFFIADTDSLFGQIFSFDPQTYALEQVSTFWDLGFAARFAAVYNGKYWFTLPFNGTKNLWNYDAATGEFTEIPVPAEGLESEFNPREKGVFDGKLFFLARNTDYQWMLWSYDDQTGTFTQEPSQFDENSFPVWDIKEFKECNGELMMNIGFNTIEKWHHYDFELDSCIFLSENNNQTYRGGECLEDKFWSVEPSIDEVEIYDPATGETELLSDMVQPSLGDPYSLKVIDDELYLWRSVNSIFKLSKYDPVANEFEDIITENNVFTLLATLIKHEDDFYYFGKKSQEREIFKIEPGDVYAQLIADINPGTADGFSWTASHIYHPFGDRVYFRANVGGLVPIETWAVDSTNGEFTNFSEQFSIGEVTYLASTSTVIDGRWYFSGAWLGSEPRQLVSYAPGEDTLRWHGNIEPQYTGGGIYAFNGITAYEGDIILGGNRDFKFDRQLFRFHPDTDTYEALPGTEGVTGFPNFILGDKLFFKGHYIDDLNKSHFFELDLVTDELTELVNDSLIISGNDLFPVGDKVACGVLDSSQTIAHILLYDPITGEKKYLLPNGFDSVQPNFPVIHEGKAWFYWNSQGSSLFTIDPVAETCEEVLNMGPEIAAGGQLIWFNDKLYFHGGTEEVGREVFEYDPATGEVGPYADIYAGPGDAWPEEFIVIGDRLYFTATDGRRGHEMWSIGTCFEVSASAVPDSLGQSEGQINLSLEGGVEPFTFEWNNGATTQHIDGLSTGYYEATVTDAEGCGATVAVLLEGGAVTSILEKEKTPSVKVYPNPASDFIRLETENLEGEMTAILFSFSGVEMRRENIRSEMTELNVSEAPSGMYFLVVKNERGGFTAQKIILER